MAKLKDDQIKWILTVDAKGAQGEIQKLVSSSEQLKDANKRMAAEMKAAEAQMKSSLKEMKLLEKQGLKTSNAYKHYENTLESARNEVADYTQRIAENTKAIEINNRAIDTTIKEMKLEEMTMSQLQQRAKSLQSQLNHTSKSASPEAYNKLKKELRNVNGQMGELKGSTDKTNKGFSLLKSGVGKFTIGATAAVGVAIKIFQKFSESSYEMEKLYSSVIDQAKAATDSFFRSISNGDWSNLLDNMREAIEAAREYRTAMDEIQNRKRSASVEEAKLRAEIAAQKVIAADVTKSEEERKDATQKALELEKQILDTRIKIASDAEKTVYKMAAKTYNINENDLKTLTETYHLREDEIEQAKKLISAETKLKNARVYAATPGSPSVYGAPATNISQKNFQNAQNEYNNLFNNASDAQIKFAQVYKKYGQIVTKVRDDLANSAKEKYDAETQYNNRIIELTTKSSNLESRSQKQAEKDAEKKLKEFKKQAEEQRKILEDSTAQINIANKEYNDSLKSAGQYGVALNDLTKEQLDERLQIEKGYQDKILQIAVDTENTRFEKEKKDSGLDGDQTGFTEQENKAFEILAANHEANIQKIKDESAKKQEDIQKSIDDTILKALQDSYHAQIDAVSATEKAKTIRLQSQLNDGLISRQEYEAELEKIESESSATRLTIQEDYVDALNNLTNPTEKQKAELQNAENQLSDLTIQYNNERLESEKEFQEKRKEIREKYGLVSMSELYKSEKEELAVQYEEGLLSEEEYEKAKLQLKLKYAQEYAQKVAQFTSMASGAISALMDAETANVEARYDAEIQAADDNAEEVERLENEKAQKKLDIEKKYADVNFAIKASEIIANTAVAIMTALKDLGPIAGPIAAALMGVTGAAQLAVANAERNKVKQMTLNGTSSSSTKTGEIKLKEGFADGGANVDSSGSEFKDLSDGGHTGIGGRYEVAGWLPAHHGEYIVPVPELKIPDVAEKVRAIEQIRRKRTNKNPLPEGFAEGGANMSPSGSSGGSSEESLEISRKLLKVFDGLINGDIQFKTNYGVTEYQAAEKEKQENESIFSL